MSVHDSAPSDDATQGIDLNSLMKIAKSLPTFEQRLIERNSILSSLTAEYVEAPSAELKIDQIKMKLARIVCRFTYHECNSLFSTVFKDFSSDRSKEVAKNNVRRLAGQNHDEEVGKIGSKVYGEIEFYSFCNLLERISIKKGETFYDLGHGTGKAMVAASLLFGDKLDSIKGIELLSDLYDTSVTAINSYITIIQSPEYSEMFQTRISGIPQPFVGDFFSEISVAEWTAADIVFANSTCFDSELMDQIAHHAIKMRQGSRLITFTRPLPSDSFRITEKLNLGMSWGAATCYIHLRL